MENEKNQTNFNVSNFVTVTFITSAILGAGATVGVRVANAAMDRLAYRRARKAQQTN